jgi:hypothetical protein
VRHQLTGNFVFTSPVGGPQSHLADNSKVGLLLRNWQLSGLLTAQTGNPLTAKILGNTTQLATVGATGSQRAEATGQSITGGSGFFNLNAFTAPASGFGNAGRDTIPGPGLVSLNLAVARSFEFKERRRIEFRLEGNNVLNHVNYTAFNTVVSSLQYGLPSTASAMRSLDVVVRLRF